MFGLETSNTRLIAALMFGRQRPHSSLGHLTQNEFVSQRQVEQTTEDVVYSG